MTDVPLAPLIALAVGYLFGSIPFGLLLTRAAGLGDIRSIGSGNIGATNVLRTGNKALAAATLVLDGVKGTVAVLVGGSLGDLNATWPALLGGFGAVVGHTFPAWLGFRGGKGVATYIGVLFGVFWPAAVIMCALWITMAALTRYSSLSALTASIVNPIMLLLLGQDAAAVIFVPLTVLLVYKHRDNIRRLIAGEEPKIGVKA